MSLTSASRSHEDYVFDVEFDVEEVSKAISKLPNRKAIYWTRWSLQRTPKQHHERFSGREFLADEYTKV
jgi:hypothetical protein